MPLIPEGIWAHWLCFEPGTSHLWAPWSITEPSCLLVLKAELQNLHNLYLFSTPLSKWHSQKLVNTHLQRFFQIISDFSHLGIILLYILSNQLSCLNANHKIISYRLGTNFQIMNAFISRKHKVISYIIFVQKTTTWNLIIFISTLFMSIAGLHMDQTFQILHTQKKKKKCRIVQKKIPFSFKGHVLN